MIETIMMQREIRAHMDKKGGVGIPAAFLKALKLQAGNEVTLRLVDGELRISRSVLEVEQVRRQAEARRK